MAGGMGVGPGGTAQDVRRGLGYAQQAAKPIGSIFEGIRGGFGAGVPASAGQLGGVGAGAVTGPGVGTQFGGALAGGLGAGLSLYDLAQAIQSGRGSALLGAGVNTVMAVPGALAAAAQMGVPGAASALSSLGSTLGVGAAVGDVAGAGVGTAGASGAGTVAAGTAGAGVAAGIGAVIAPVIIGVLGYMQQNEKIQAERFAARELRDKLGFSQEQVNRVVNDLTNVDPNKIDPSKLQQYINGLGMQFQTNEGLPATGGIHVAGSPLEYAYRLSQAGANPSAEDPTGAQNQAAANQYGKDMLSGTPSAYERLAYLMSQNPNLVPPSWEMGGGKTRDVQSAAQTYGGGPLSTWYEHLPNTPAPYTSGGFETGQEGGPVPLPPIPNPELGGQFSPEVLSSPYFAQEYWQKQGITPQMAFLYGAGQNARQAGVNIPGLPGDVSGYDPKAVYDAMVKAGMPGLEPQAAAPTQTGGVQSGEAGKAVGRLTPRNVVTGGTALPRPESDARTEAVFGMRRPLVNQPPDQGGGLQTPPPVPGTSGAEPRAFGTGGGFAVAPGGNIGTGGLVIAPPFSSRPGQGNSGGL